VGEGRNLASRTDKGTGQAGHPPLHSAIGKPLALPYADAAERLLRPL